MPVLLSASTTPKRRLALPLTSLNMSLPRSGQGSGQQQGEHPQLYDQPHLLQLGPLPLAAKQGSKAAGLYIRLYIQYRTSVQRAHM